VTIVKYPEAHLILGTSPPHPTGPSPPHPPGPTSRPFSIGWLCNHFLVVPQVASFGVDDQYGWYVRSACSFHRTTRSNLVHCIHQLMCSPESAEFHHGGSCRTLSTVPTHHTCTSISWIRITVHRVDRYHTNRITATGTVSVPTLQLLCHYYSHSEHVVYTFQSFVLCSMRSLGRARCVGERSNRPWCADHHARGPSVHVPSVHGW
jgi:hypothetical protein